MNRSQWIKYITILDRMSEVGTIKHEQKIAVIDALIEADRKEAHEIEMINAGLKVKPNK